MLYGLQIFSARLSAPRIGLLLEGYLLPFGQSMKARTFDCADVDKYVRPTVVRLNKAIAFLAVEKLHNTRCHFGLQCLRNRLLPTQNVSKFDPAMSWGKSPTGRGHQGSQIARTSSLYPFGKSRHKNNVRTYEPTAQCGSGVQWPKGSHYVHPVFRRLSRAIDPLRSAPIRCVGGEGARAHLHTHPSGPFGC